MHALTLAPQTQTYHGAPAQEIVRTEKQETVRAAETARPASAPDRAEQVRGHERPAWLSEPARAEARSVMVVQNEGLEPERTDLTAEEFEPDPMVPPVPIRYLAQLMNQRDSQPSERTEDLHGAKAVDRAEATEERAESGSSLDILR